MIWLILIAAGLAEDPPSKAFDGPPQAARGHALFFDRSKATHCGTCHEMAGKGTAVGPDLKRLARMSPRALTIAIRATRTQYVKDVTLGTSANFPAMERSKNDNGYEFYDLSVTPPALRTLTKGQVASIKDNATWKHPPESTGYTTAQLADIIAYVRFASFGDRRGVDPSELE